MIDSVHYRKYRWIWLNLLVFSLAGTGCHPNTPPSGVNTQVERVISGQTIEVAGSLSTVRLLGINAPDNQQKPWGPAARDYLQTLIGNQPVVLEIDESTVDPFDRTLAYVWHDQTLINAKLVEAGHALVNVQQSPNPRHTQTLIRAQEQGRLLGLGIWDPNTPMRLTPQEFRSQNQ